jgi:DNA adenine methylase
MRRVSPEAARPLLKWAGGKRQLLPALSPHYPAHFDRYVEPFFGSGAVFFDLYARGLLAARRARLADVNPDLVGCYRTVRDNSDAVIGALSHLQASHRAAGDDFYYEVRDRRFNPARALLHDTPREAAAVRYTPELAAMLIFLNRTGFNGLFRLNRAAQARSTCRWAATPRHGFAIRTTCGRWPLRFNRDRSLSTARRSRTSWLMRARGTSSTVTRRTLP